MTITILEGLGNAMPKKKYGSRFTADDEADDDGENGSGLRQRHGGGSPKRRGGFLDGGEGGNDDRRHQQSSTQPRRRAAINMMNRNMKGAPLLLLALMSFTVSSVILYKSMSPQKGLVLRMNKNLPRHHEITDNESYKFLESKMMHKWLDGLKGIEIGASAHNGFGLDTTNVDYTANVTVFSEEQIAMGGSYRRVDIIAPGDDLPFADGSVDFVISSHAIEHFHDPIGAICEWLRVVKTGGYVATIAPHKERTFDIDNNRTTLQDLLHRHEHPIDPKDDDHRHWSIWITEDFIEMCRYMGWNVVDFLDTDDKVGNGFAVIIFATPTSRSKCQSVHNMTKVGRLLSKIHPLVPAKLAQV